MRLAAMSRGCMYYYVYPSGGHRLLEAGYRTRAVAQQGLTLVGILLLYSTLCTRTRTDCDACAPTQPGLGQVFLEPSPEEAVTRLCRFDLADHCVCNLSRSGLVRAKMTSPRRRVSKSVFRSSSERDLTVLETWMKYWSMTNRLKRTDVEVR